MKKDRDNLGMYPYMPYNMPYNMGMGMPNMIPMPGVSNNNMDMQINNLNNRLNMLEKRVAKLEGSNITTTYDSNYYMV